MIGAHLKKLAKFVIDLPWADRVIRRVAVAKGYKPQIVPQIIRKHPEKEILTDVRHLIAYRLLHGKGFFFVQIGAHDGAWPDPLFDFVKEFHLPGILVEPQRDTFNSLLQNYSDSDNLVFENVAISHKEEKRKLYKVKEEYQQLYTYANLIPSFDYEFVKKHFGKNLVGMDLNVEDCIEYEMVDCMSLEALLKKHNVTRIDLLQIDTEGFDYEIIKMIEMNCRKPGMINYEHRHLTRGDQEECWRYLVDQGYSLYVNGPDTCALLQTA